MILAIETSCDDTCAAVVTAAGEMRSNVISSQGVHDRYGGVVPEVAARHHLALVNDVVDDALRTAGATLDDVDLVAVTQGPGLVGALLVGVATAKGIAAGRGLPLAPVDHLQGHVAANFLGDAFAPPFLCLVASGGHTFLARVEDHAGYMVLGTTLDDAAGEAFDKGARLLAEVADLVEQRRLQAREREVQAGHTGGDREVPASDRRGAGPARRARPARDRPAAPGDRRRRGGQRTAARAHGRARRRPARARARAVH